MDTEKMMLAIEDEDGPVCECTVDQFCNDNDFDTETRGDLAFLAIGASLKLGGGAAPIFTVTRLS